MCATAESFLTAAEKKEVEGALANEKTDEHLSKDRPFFPVLSGKMSHLGFHILIIPSTIPYFRNPSDVFAFVFEHMFLR